MPVYKCSRCGHRSHTFAAMSKHARKHKFTRHARPVKATNATHYCPICGVMH